MFKKILVGLFGLSLFSSLVLANEDFSVKGDFSLPKHSCQGETNKETNSLDNKTKGCDHEGKKACDHKGKKSCDHKGKKSCDHKLKENKFENLSVEEIKSHVSEKISLKEQNIASQKSCLEKQNKDELVSCLKQTKEDKKEMKMELKNKSFHEGE